MFLRYSYRGITKIDRWRKKERESSKHSNQATGPIRGADLTMEDIRTIREVKKKGRQGMTNQLFIAMKMLVCYNCFYDYGRSA